MWEDQDHYGFHNETMNDRGQITMQTQMGQLLCSLAKDPENRHFLEIGTWNGLGSTRCFHEGFKRRPLSTSNTQPSTYFLDSLEVNKDKCNVARTFYKDAPEVRIHHKTILTTVPSWEDIVKDLGGAWTLSEQDTLRGYFQVDEANARECGTFHPSHCPVDHSKDTTTNCPFFMYDVVLLDGSELLSYYEYQIVSDWTRVLILDDSNCNKNKKVYEELTQSPHWNLLEENRTERNGYAAFIKSTVHETSPAEQHVV